MGVCKPSCITCVETKIRKIRKFIQAQTSNLNVAARSFSPHNETLQPIQNVGAAYSLKDDSQNTGYNFTTLRSNSSVNSSNFHKLPKLNLPTFDGNVLEWQSFWDSFDSAIHNNNTLTDVQKFNLNTIQKHFGDIPNYLHSASLTNSISRTLELFTSELDVHLLALLNYPHSYLEKVSREPVVKKIAFHTRIPLLVIPEMSMGVATKRNKLTPLAAHI